MKKTFLILSLSVLITCFFTGFLYAAGKGPVPAPKTKPPVTQPLPPVAGRIALPDLVVTQVKLDQQNRIVLEIKNNGPGAIAEPFFAQSSVRVTYGSANVEFLLGGPFNNKPAVDPQGRLKNPGGSILFDTGLILEKPAEVMVTADANQKIVEADEGRAGNSKKVFLSPQISGGLKPKPALPAIPQTTVKQVPAMQAPSSAIQKITPPAPDPDFGAPFTVESVNIVDVPHGSLIPVEKLSQTFRIRLRLKSTNTVPNRASISAKWYVQLKLEAEGSRPLTLSQALQISLMPGQKDYFMPFQPRNIPDLGFTPRLVDLRYTLIDIQAPPPGPTPPDGSQNTPPPPPNTSGPTVSLPAGTQAPSVQIAQGIVPLNNAAWGERQNVFKAALAVPQINFVMPNPGAKQARITVKGAKFGQQRSDVKLALQKQGASAFIEPQIYSWKEDTIEFKAPDANGIFSVAVYDNQFQSGSNKVVWSIADYIDIPAQPSSFINNVRLTYGAWEDKTNKLIMRPFTPPNGSLPLTPPFAAPIHNGWTRLIASTPANSNKWCYVSGAGLFIEVHGKYGLGDCSRYMRQGYFGERGWLEIEVPDFHLGYDVKAVYDLALDGLANGTEVKYMSSGFSIQIPFRGSVHPAIFLVNSNGFVLGYHYAYDYHEDYFDGHLSILIKVKVVDQKITVEDVTCAISGDLDYLPELNSAWSQTKGPLIQYLSQQLMNRKKGLEDALTEKIQSQIGPLKALHKLEFIPDNKIRVYYSDVSLNLTPQTSTPVIPAPGTAPSN